LKKIIMFILSAIILLPLLACTQTVQAGELKSAKPRLTPSVNTSDTASLVDGNNTFAFNLYQRIKDEDSNLFFSPYSISQALAMTYGGARGVTAQQMAAALQFNLEANRLHPAFNGLDLELAKRGQGAKGKDEKGFRLHIVNAIWGQKDYKFQADYLDLLAQNYSAGLRVVDFIKAAEDSRLKINQWASDQTEGKIKDLLPQGSIDELTRLVLTNAIYFNAAWQSQFHKEATTNKNFSLLDGSQVSVPMMKQQASFAYNEGSDYQALELPYDGRELSMLIILPKADRFKAFETALSSQQVSTIIQGLKNSQVNLSMPKFTFAAEFSLSKALKEAGMTAAFSPSEADFSGMDGAKDLYITDVVHKAFVAVDEAGTEAAAVTAVVVGTTSMPMEVKEVTLDHPFIFLIRDIQTNSILFVGRTMNPAK
jgi:serpin B